MQCGPKDPLVSGKGGVKIRSKASLDSIYRTLKSKHGHLGWWPGQTRLEIAIGAILTQNTTWKNAASAIRNLKKEGFLSFRGLKRVPLRKLAKTIYASGYYNQKALKIKNFIRFLDKKTGGRLQPLSKFPLSNVREELLSVSGIGPETADAILLYALQKPIFVVDAYTRRIFSRLGYLTPEVARSYEKTQQFFHTHLPKDMELYNDFHAQIVRLGHTVCRKQPKCERCPLAKSCLFAETDGSF